MSSIQAWCAQAGNHYFYSYAAIPAPAANDFLDFFEDGALGLYWHLGNLDFESAAHYLDEIGEVFATCDSEPIRVRLPVMRVVLCWRRENWAGTMIRSTGQVIIFMGIPAIAVFG